MRKIKLAFWLIVAGFVGLVAWQNQIFFLEPKKIHVDLFFARYETPDFPALLFFLVMFFTGLFIAYVSSLSEKFIAKKTIRTLNSELAAAKKKISDQEQTLQSLQNRPVSREVEVPAAPSDGLAAAEEKSGEPASA